MRSKPNEVKKIRYLECDKGGFHYGEVINMICLEPSCLEDLLCCCACIEESHKKHLTMPLKMVMEEAKEQAELMKPTNFNIDVILDIMNTSQKATLQIYKSCRKQIEKNLDDIEKSLIGYYNSVIQQIKLKNSDPKAEVSTAFEVIGSTNDIQQLKSWGKKLVAMIPNKENEQQRIQVNEQELIKSVKSSNDEINEMISQNIEEVNSKLRQYQKTLEESVNSTNIWKKANNFKFSSTLKHPDIKVLSDYHVKSTNTSGYKFAVMQPHLQKGNSNKTFYFKIKQCSSNWVAVGMCHKNIVATKNYGFNFSNLGHGGYMISANGGTWCNTQNEYNNKVKAFKFAKNDVISVTVDMGTKKILFEKKAETYEIPFQTIDSDELHPCALFYYINDEVQFLPNFKP